MKIRTVLIIGSGIAGPVLAHFLHRKNIQVTIVERAPQLRSYGQTIDLRGAGREVARRMGIDAEVRNRITREAGLAFVDAAGDVKASFTADSFGGQGLVCDTEILRGELVDLLYEHSRRDAEYLFGDHPLTVTDLGDQVRVVFASGAERSFDLVIGADGIRSRTRRLVCPDTPAIHYLDMYTAYFTIPYQPGDGQWARWYNAGRGRTLLLRPDNQGTTRAFLSFRSKHRGHEELSRAEQQALLHEVFADAGFDTARVLRDMAQSPDFYFEAIGQVKLPQWSNGRVALVGDAAYCASPISGMGTSLALVGAYILAGELGSQQDHRQALQRYQALMRPYVRNAQRIAPGALRFASPHSRAGVRLSNAVLGVLARPAVSGLIGKLNKPKADAIALPDYPAQA